MSTIDKASRFRHQLILLSITGQGMTLRGIAQKLSVSPALVTMVSQGRRRNRRVQKALARLCGRPVDELFSEDDVA